MTEAQKTKSLDKIELGFEKQIMEGYKKANNNIKLELIKLEEKGLLTYTDMQNYNRLKSLQEKIRSEINELQKSTGKTLTTEQMTLYESARDYSFDVLSTQAETRIDIDLLPKEAIKEAVKNPLDYVGAVQRNADNAANMIKKINQNILTGLIQGKSYAKIATGINKDMDLGYKNSLRIARTEAHRVREKGTLNAYEEAKEMGLQIVKVWSSAKDDRTREAHIEANGQEVEIDEPFIVDGEELMFPGDPSGSAENVINCRCSMITKIKNFDKNKK